jgi:tRNA(Ile)-lysidine synthase
VLREDNAWLDRLAADLLERCTLTGGALDVDALRVEPVAARRRVLRRWLTQHGIPGSEADYRTVARLDALLRARRGTGRCPLGEGLAARREYGRLLAEQDRDSRAGASGPDAAPYRVAVRLRGETLLPDRGLRVITEVGPGLERSPGRLGAFPAVATIRYAAVGRRRVFVRSWAAGDRMRPLGMGGSKKIQDIFVDAKLPVRARRRVPLFECGRQIVWLPGYRVARGWEVLDPAADALRITVERI